MSKINNVARNVVVLMAVLNSVAFGQNCKLSGTTDWNPSLRSVLADCSFTLPSPDGQLRLNVTASGVMSLWKNTEAKKAWRGPKLQPPAMVSWSPKSDTFFVNDGEGSGMSSVFRVFRVNGIQVMEDDSIERAAVALYRRRTHCTRSSADPNVWGFGWGMNGDSILLFVQPTVDEPCGPSGNFIGLIVQTSDGKIVETIPEVQMKKRFDSLLPPEMFSK